MGSAAGYAARLSGWDPKYTSSECDVKTRVRRICMHRKRVNISTVLANQRAGIKKIDESIWIESFMQ